MAETTAWHSHCQFITFITVLFTVNVNRQMAPLFSKVDSNKLWHDAQNEENVICAQFGKDLFNISKVIGRKKWPSFFTHSVIYFELEKKHSLTHVVTNCKLTRAAKVIWQKATSLDGAVVCK